MTTFAEEYRKINDLAGGLVEKIVNKSDQVLGYAPKGAALLLLHVELTDFLVGLLDKEEVENVDGGAAVPVRGPLQYVGSDKFPPAPENNFSIWIDGNGRPHLVEDGWIEKRGFVPAVSWGWLDAKYVDGSETENIHTASVYWPNVVRFRDAAIPF